jgi:hypothetical protein
MQEREEEDEYPADIHSALVLLLGQSKVIEGV